MQSSLDAAVGVLWALTGRRFAVEETAVRPCPRYDYYDTLDVTRGVFMPTLDAGVWRNAPFSCGCADRPSPTVIHLPGPVVKVLSVNVEGVVIAPESWVQDGHRLYRAAGLSWPAQNLMAPLGAPGTWAVTYLRGTPPPAGAARAVGDLAREFYAACTEGGKCRLPRRTQSVTRQGVSVTMVDPSDIFDTGATGLPTVDLWIRAHNPHHLAQPTMIASPDVMLGS